MVDAKGQQLAIGDAVVVVYVDRDRGAELWMHRGEVVGFGRTRARVCFPSRTDPQTVGPECLRVVPH